MPLSPSLEDIGERYHTHRKQMMLVCREGLTKTYNRFHNPEEASPDILKLRQLHAALDNAVVTAYGWTDLELNHGFHETKQGVRYTISEPARREVLARLLKLNHERYAEEVKQGLHEKRNHATYARHERKQRKASCSSRMRQVFPPRRSTMSLIETVIEGTLKPDGTLGLDEKPNLPAGRVTVILRQGAVVVSPKDDPFWQRMQAMWAIPRTAGKLSDGGANTLAEVHKMREEWQEYREALERL